MKKESTIRIFFKLILLIGVGFGLRLLFGIAYKYLVVSNTLYNALSLILIVVCITASTFYIGYIVYWIKNLWKQLLRKRHDKNLESNEPPTAGGVEQ